MNNIIFAVLHLQKASDLLKYNIPSVSDSLLKLAFTLINNEKIKMDDINQISSLINNISEYTDE